jgi:hypothetical protein
MKPMDIFRLAVAEIGNVSAAELSAHLEKKHGVKIEPAYIPVFRERVRKNGQASRGGKIHTVESTRAINVNQGIGGRAGNPSTSPHRVFIRCKRSLRMCVSIQGVRIRPSRVPT